MPRTATYSFLLKPAAAAGLVGLADAMLFDHEVGWTLGLAALAVPLAALTLQPALRRDRLALGALLAASAFALVQVERPTLIGLLLFWTSLCIAVLAPRAGRAEDAWRWAQRLGFLGLASPVAPWLDLVRLEKARKRGGPRRRIRDLLPVLILPIVGGAIFLRLFAAANPLIENAVENLRLPEVDAPRALFWIFGLIAAWAILRPRTRRRWLPLPEGLGTLPGVGVASVTLSLIVFNALFALQNGLDLAFLWSGAALPEGTTLAEYAHRGAYPLIATALLAGLFVLVALQPGSATAQSPLIRKLVVLWIVQNIFLVASTALRTLDYIGAYSLTRLRIAALIWMGLVALGLALICWRLIRGKSAAWLLGTNAAALAAVLAASSVIDLGAVAAHWNVRHAREVGGRGAALDVCYLRNVGPAALVSLAELERRPLPPDLRARVAEARQSALERLSIDQSHWRSWTFRGARRLSAANRLVEALPPPPHATADCAGVPYTAPAARRPL
ncbi:DUF4173 domain-containing protein [Phenylobacterium sp.]|jgi:hypothetical protein|uniref:DUF4153 domain-containing protein n=1 Tax=Phenylobacterium sp. TaxID=1871053 RepID=UPI002E30D6BB|nr:DUF4173 domain-containing protein [Phenylobacterium sp.]HEX2560950.1 DUF4173 domain-containing protein [Phenylobacterium sp.]